MRYLKMCFFYSFVSEVSEATSPEIALNVATNCKLSQKSLSCCRNKCLHLPTSMTESHHLFSSYSQTHMQPSQCHTASCWSFIDSSGLIGRGSQLRGDSGFHGELSQQLLTVIAVHLHTPSSHQNQCVFTSYHRDKQVTHETE